MRIKRRTFQLGSAVGRRPPSFARHGQRTGQADHHRLRHGADRRARAQRQGGAAGHADLGPRTINAKGGLLGRPVKLVYYDDQSNPSTVPGLYTKLIDVDKVDIVVSGYATNMVAPAMPVVMQKDRDSSSRCSASR